MKILPKSKLGKWAAGLGIAFMVLILLKMQIGFPLPTFGIAALGIAGFVCGVIALFKSKDRSVLVILALLLGLLIIFWMGAEIIYPH